MKVFSFQSHVQILHLVLELFIFQKRVNSIVAEYAIYLFRPNLIIALNSLDLMNRSDLLGSDLDL